MGDYKRNPVVPLRLAAFASDLPHFQILAHQEYRMLRVRLRAERPKETVRRRHRSAWARRASCHLAMISICGHGLPQERYYNLLCLAIGAQREVFAELEVYLPTTRFPHCIFEYRRLAHAFDKAITPHIDPEMAKRVLDTNWLESLETKPISPK